MGQLGIALLGTPDVAHAGGVLALPSRKALALLAYLAVEGGLQSREKLAMLWSCGRTKPGASCWTRNYARDRPQRPKRWPNVSGQPEHNRARHLSAQSVKRVPTQSGTYASP